MIFKTAVCYNALLPLIGRFLLCNVSKVVKKERADNRISNLRVIGSASLRLAL